MPGNITSSHDHYHYPQPLPNHHHHHQPLSHNLYNPPRNHSPDVMSGTSAFVTSPAVADEEHLRRMKAREAVDGSGVGRGGNENVEITATQKMLAACSGSLLTSLLVTPLDVVRVRLQSQHPTTPSFRPTTSSTPLRAQKLPLAPLTFHTPSSAPSLGVTACCREVFWITNTDTACLALSPASDTCLVEDVSRRRFHGTWEGLVKIARYEGVTTLWRGLSPTLLMAVPANVIYFTGYDSLRASPWSPFSSLGSTWAPLLAGSSARTIAATVISPLELFRTRLQASGAPHTFRDTLSGVRDMVASAGVSSLWRGLGLTLWRDVPFSGVYWFGYEAIKEGLQREREKEWHLTAPLHRVRSGTPKDLHAESTFADSFVSGAASGAVAAFLTTPFDVGKTRRQVGGEGRGSMVRALYGIWRGEGVQGLWRGCVPRMLKVAPACAIMISSYEVGKKAAAKINQRSELQL